MKALEEPVLLFSLHETAEAVELDPQSLREWVRAGVVAPAVPGSKGRGKSHKFGAEQGLGLAVACWLWLDDDRGCRRLDYLGENVKRHEAWGWQAVTHCLGLQQDAWTEEAYAKAMSTGPPG